MAIRIDPFWLNRWHSLHTSIAKTQSDNGAGSNIEDLLDALDNFGSKQFFYFYFGFFEQLTNIFNETESNTVTRDGFVQAFERIEQPLSDDMVDDIFSVLHIDDDHLDEILKPQRLALDFDFPPDYVLRTVIDQIIYDYEVIKRALLQLTQGTDEEKLTLVKANSWGQLILNKFSTPETGYVKLLHSPARMIAYFNRSPRIRMIPYGNVALIGIPPTTTLPSKRRDMLSIPHELGHYIYWNGRIDNRSIREIIADKIQGQLPFVKNWIEELFADVFAVAASEHQDAMFHWASTMIKDNPPSKLWQDNGIHPIDAVRERIYFRRIYTDKKPAGVVGNGNNGSADSGNPIKDNRKGEPSFKTRDRNGDEINFLIDELLEVLEPIANEINDLILSQSGTPTDGKVSVNMDEVIKKITNPSTGLRPKGILTSTDGGMSKYPPEYVILPSFNSRAGIESVLTAIAEVNKPAQKEAWYDDFEAMLEDLDPVDPVSDPDPDKPEPVRTFITMRDSYFGPQPLETSIWKVIFSADGWTVKGPETGPPGDWEADSMRNAFHF